MSCLRVSLFGPLALHHFLQEMENLHQLIDDLNLHLYNPAGLNILWPRKVAFMFVRAFFFPSPFSPLVLCPIPSDHLFLFYSYP